MASRPATSMEFLLGALTARSGPQEASVGQIVEFQHLFLSPLFVVYATAIILGSLVIIFYFGPKSIFTRPLLIFTALTDCLQDTEARI